MAKKSGKNSSIATRNRLVKLAVPTTGKSKSRFTVGNKKAKGGARLGAGRPTLKEEQAKAEVLEQLRLGSPDDLAKLNDLIESEDSSAELKAKILMWKMNKVVPDLKQLEGGDTIIVQILTNMPGSAISHGSSQN